MLNHPDIAHAAFEVTLHGGGEVQACLGLVSDMRVRLFREYPYLYDATPQDENEYLATYLSAPGAVVVMAQAGGQIIGTGTLVPLSAEDESFRAGFVRAGYDPGRVLYVGEGLVEPECQSSGVGGDMLTAAERYAEQRGYTHICCAMVVREPAHPLRPPRFRTPQTLLERRGYHAEPELDCPLSWREVGGEQSVPHVMRFWVRALSESIRH